MKINELEKDECWEVVDRTKFGRIACSVDDQPYVVPFNFMVDEKQHLYAFSTVGQKIEWMRKNPLVCVEVEELTSSNDWTTVIILGRFEELINTPEYKAQRIFAYFLLSSRPMWWQPAYAAGANRDRSNEEPVYFRINVEKISGHRAESELVEKFFPEGLPKPLQKNDSHGLW
jgi:nitroimidazol reductase NimA-like FMN-containing flavoprotein (pyridoxamine 5'-phosphate oxidase superfamily)